MHGAGIHSEIQLEKDITNINFAIGHFIANIYGCQLLTLTSVLTLAKTIRNDLFAELCS